MERETRTLGQRTAEDSGSDRPTLCIVLADDRGPLSHHVHGAIAARRWQTIETHDPLDAMLRLCLLDRMQSARAGWGLPRMQDLAILMPSKASRPSTQISQAIQQYLPDIAIWTFDSIGELALVHAGSSESAAAPPMRLVDGMSDARPTAPESRTAVRQHAEAAVKDSDSSFSPLQFPGIRQIAEIRHDAPPERLPEIRPRIELAQNELAAPEDDTVDIKDSAITRQEIAMLLEMERHEADS
jgi:hypothetical protein